MSRINYESKNKGARLVSSEEAWVSGKNGKFKLNPKYNFIGKVDSNMSGMILSTTKGKKPRFKGDICDLNNTAKNQLVQHFYDDDGKRNKRTVAYFGIEKKDKNSQDSKKSKKKVR